MTGGTPPDQNAETVRTPTKSAANHGHFTISKAWWSMVMSMTFMLMTAIIIAMFIIGEHQGWWTPPTQQPALEINQAVIDKVATELTAKFLQQYKEGIVAARAEAADKATAAYTTAYGACVRSAGGFSADCDTVALRAALVAAGVMLQLNPGQ